MKVESFILDSYALLAYFEDEKGAAAVEKLLKRAESGNTRILMTLVNWVEVFYSTWRAKGEARAEEALLSIEQLPISLVSVDKHVAYEAARLKAVHSLALGDCFAAALAIVTDGKVVTGDNEFKLLEKKVRIAWLE